MTDAERIYQLMVVTARADETVDAREARVMVGIVNDTAALQELGDRSALTRAARSLLEVMGQLRRCFGYTVEEIETIISRQD